MTEQNKIYIESHKLWLKSNKLNIEEHELNSAQNKDRIKIIEKQVELDDMQIKNCLDFRAAAIEDFAEWCKLNNIEPTQI